MNLDRVGPGRNLPREFNVIIEIPMNADPIKYEVDKETGALFVDRFMMTAMHYPCNYGYIPHTIADDVGRVTPDSDVAADASTGSTTESSDQAAGTQGEAPGSSTASASPSDPAREGRKGGAGEEPGLGKD